MEKGRAEALAKERIGKVGLADKVVFMADGRILEEGKPEEIFPIRRRQRQDSSCGAFCSRVMNKFVMRQSLLLLLTATIWGVAFVAQSVGMDYIGPFTFNVVRNVIGGLVLIPCIAVFHRTGAKEEDAGKTPGSRKICCLAEPAAGSCFLWQAICNRSEYSIQQ